MASSPRKGKGRSKKKAAPPSPEAIARATGLRMDIEEVSIKKAAEVAIEMLRPYDGASQGLMAMAALTAYFFAMLSPEMIEQLQDENDRGTRLGRFLDAASPEIASLFHLAITPDEQMGTVQ